ncbi:hypothetical protein CP98_01541 [Sphingobium yanoikuyae]|jgi:hypothetical protein|uniref:Uncharacterized protein n=2 Tax=Sphingomonadaceae TaxID=41297 RepID=A0A084EPJ9_SPHYA|nr:hypothetical protein BV97_04341 [Novosphingobium resinovorum]KEZ19891.1 hypothetical protein CP98_01541 [Sphingobium yanoikuyae]
MSAGEAACRDLHLAPNDKVSVVVVAIIGVAVFG